MGRKFENWKPRDSRTASDLTTLQQIIWQSRHYTPIQNLSFGDHGLQSAIDVLATAIQQDKKIALYADYDVDGTMSCVSWIWFLQSIGYQNFIPYIPCRMREGYGVNLQAVQHLVEEENVQVIITMDTGITANAEAAYCKARGVHFICTDHHTIQPEKMPDCLIVNPKLHPDPAYQELCGCGITFVVLRQLALRLGRPAASDSVWTDLLALSGMATICDVVPLNPVNHRLAQLGVKSLTRSSRTILKELMKASSVQNLSEKDVGFRLGPRINAVGRLRHAELILRAFQEEDPSALIREMEACNEERRTIQEKIVREALLLAEKQTGTSPILFLGGDWHPGVVGIAASKIAETFWRPTWLFQRGKDICKGSARSIPGFDVTQAMSAAKNLWTKFGGHRAAGGFSFDPAQEEKIHACLHRYAEEMHAQASHLWRSSLTYDCELDAHLLGTKMADQLDDLRPFGHGFDEPTFLLRGQVHRVDYYKDKRTGAPKHTALHLLTPAAKTYKILFFNEVLENLTLDVDAQVVLSIGKSSYRGVPQLDLYGVDLHIH